LGGSHLISGLREYCSIDLIHKFSSRAVSLSLLLPGEHHMF